MATTNYNPNLTYKYESSTVLTQTLSSLPVPEGMDESVARKEHRLKRSLGRRIMDWFRGRKAEIPDLRPVKNPVDVQKTSDSIWKEYNALPDLNKLYSDLEPFAEGGQGILSRAMDKTLKRPIAIKTLKKKLLHNLQERDGFIVEAKITAQLQHTGIIPIYNLCRDAGDGIHLAMKLVKGRSLDDYLKAIDASMQDMKIQLWIFRERIHRRLEIFLRVCDTISYAHSRGIIHCDLKPENILIGEFGAVYVMDWGIAKIVRNEAGESLAQENAGQMDGTPSFMPPEAYCGKGRDERSDIFALGLILYEIVTLNRGYSGADLEEVMVQIKYGRRNPIRHRHGYSISSAMMAIIDKATAYDACDRYNTVDELANDIRCYMAGLETKALPDGPIKAVCRHIARHRLQWLIIVLFAILVAIFFLEFFNA